MRSRRTDFIVGFVITLAIIILIFGIIYLKEYSIGKETRVIYALFEDVGTLTEGDPVKINGVKMGKVVSRVLKDNQVMVGMELEAEVNIPSDSRVTIQNVGLMGERMIGIRLGTSPAPLDEKVPMKGTFDSGIAEAMGMLGEVFVDAKELILMVQQLMDETVGNKEFLELFKSVTLRLDRLTIALDRMVAGNEQTFNTIIRDVGSATTDLKAFLDKNKGGMQNIVNNFNVSSDKAAVIVTKAEGITQKLDKLLETMNAEDGTVSQILKDKELYATMKSTLTEADSLLKSINKTGKLKVKIGF
jgi:phospholipid/cholesterol/gamma-HCH transport system substrate-binding protein